MKRDPRLRPLSGDHHHALALARRASLAATDQNPGALEDTWDEVVQRFDDELTPHFEIEERFLLPAMTTWPYATSSNEQPSISGSDWSNSAPV